MIACKKTRLTAAGNIVGASAMLHWLMVENPNSSIRHITLNDAASGATGEIIKFHQPAQRTMLYTFDPPMPFLNGIRISAFEHADTRVVGGYTD